VLHWKTLRRQIRMRGSVEVVSDGEADAYFATRPRVSQIGAHASKQSRPLANRYTLLERVETLKKSFGEDEPVARPRNWSGFRLVPQMMEFWKDGANRLHDRVRFTRSADGSWSRQRLYP
ncbi:MAG TPA: pyridoxal 5'-phosphate synthase, partial [Devosia sp.]